VKYTYVGISLNELSGLRLHCTAKELAAAPGGACPITSGEQTIAALGLNAYSIPLCAGILLALIVATRLAAYVGLRVLKW
jgi:ATP-binding cassette subfamily G (WHITE) protein 2